MRGKVKFFNELRGFGFVAPDDGSPDVFIGGRVKAKSGLDKIAVGTAVEFEIGRGTDGKVWATELRKL